MEYLSQNLPQFIIIIGGLIGSFMYIRISLAKQEVKIQHLEKQLDSEVKLRQDQFAKLETYHLDLTKSMHEMSKVMSGLDSTLKHLLAQQKHATR